MRVDVGRFASALVLILAAGACSSGPQEQPQGAGAVFGGPGTLVLLRCDGRGADTIAITLSKMSAADGRIMATRQATLSQLASGLNDPCSANSNRRQMFSADFGLIAVRAAGPNDSGWRAVAMETTSGRMRGSAAGGFSASPKDSSPTFHPQTGELWYVDTVEGRVRSRPADAPDEQATDRGDAGRGGTVVISGGATWLVRGAGGPDSLAANPSGTYAALTDFNGMKLWWHGTPEGEAGHFSGQTAAGLTEIGGKSVPSGFQGGCVPQFWVDDHMLVCRTRTNFHRVTLSDDYKTVTDVKALLPDTDRANSFAVLSPDRTAMAFLSTQGEARSVYRQELMATGEPRKLADLTSDEVIITWQ